MPSEVEVKLSNEKGCASPAEGEVTTGEAQFPNGTAPDPLTFWYDAAKAAQTENASLRAKLDERDADAERYREFRRAVYIEQDESFDAYDAEGMDAELDRRRATRKAGA